MTRGPVECLIYESTRYLQAILPLILHNLSGLHSYMEKIKFYICDTLRAQTVWLNSRERHNAFRKTGGLSTLYTGIPQGHVLINDVYRELGTLGQFLSQY